MSFTRPVGDEGDPKKFAFKIDGQSAHLIWAYGPQNNLGYHGASRGQLDVMFVQPTTAPTVAPTQAPTPPTMSPTPSPTVTPTPSPTQNPTPVGCRVDSRSGVLEGSCSKTQYECHLQLTRLVRGGCMGCSPAREQGSCRAGCQAAINGTMGACDQARLFTGEGPEGRYGVHYVNTVC